MPGLSVVLVEMAQRNQTGRWMQGQRVCMRQVLDSMQS